MKISVIVAVYNRLEYLKNILLALEAQIEKPYEVIIADDGSYEDLEKAITKILPQLSYKLKHVYQQDIGFRLSRSRNNAVRFSEGELLLFLDQDILFDNHFIKNIKEIIKEGLVIKMDAVSLKEKETEKIKIELNNQKKFDYKIIDKYVTKDEKKIIKKKYQKDIIRNLLYNLNFAKRGAKIIGLGIGIFKKNFIELNGFDENYIGWGYEDDDLCNRIYCYGLKVVPFNYENILVHMYHGEDTTKKTSLNEKYYYKRKDEIFGKRDYKCEYGYDNPKDKDECKIKLIK
ncbi:MULTISPECIES: glycosyltransferase [Fusobacterium]|uniref:glycosyltransferase n=1 Tax=Fusobacterium TaxID=848 RepID=UPI0008A4DBEB|nr:MULTISPECIES: glycosyltransferase [Fusobacterium]OFL81851.1 hypothetical protein HMPREF2747_12850 [Fusobacterium sp. HMSC073F01]